MKRIIGIGNALVDVLIKLENDNFLVEHSLPKGSMQLVDKEVANKLLLASHSIKPQLTSGGSASNTIHGLAKLGLQTSYIGKIGSDSYGKIFSDDLKQNKISPVLLNSKNESGCALTFITPDSERTFATFLGAAVELCADDLTPELFEGYDLLHLEGYLIFNNALVEKAVALAKSKGLHISIDLASFNVVEANREFLLKIIKDSVDIVFANEEEAKALTGEEPEKALLTIAELCDIAVVKIGSKGSMVKRGNDMVRVEAIKAKAIDTTGAGDLYASGFLYGLSQGWNLGKCARLGSLTAGKVVETLGAKISTQVWDEINKTIHAL
jgi:sugar/nucleoside kinase (ribokinase family)